MLAQVEKNQFSERVYYSSFDSEVLTEMRKLNATAELGLILDTDENNQQRMESILKTALSLNVAILSPDHAYLNRAQLQSLQKLGFRVIPWTVNSPSRWIELMEMGVDGIITDYPQELIECLLRSTNSRGR